VLVTAADPLFRWKVQKARALVQLYLHPALQSFLQTKSIPRIANLFIMKTTVLTAIAGSTLVAAAPAHIGSRASKVQYAGINIAGFDFGCTTDGSCSLTGNNKPYNIVQSGTAIGQMNHFVKDDTLNAFRLPVGWQFLLNNQLGGKLDSNNFGQYDSLVRGCLNSGASLCILDLHNYARWNGAIVGQGGPTDAQLADVWKQLAQKYGSQSKIAFGVMNEPHVSYVHQIE
jgi:aryl-phospho-beta-D-glucosidase BglC (GH1 family)